MSRYEELEAFVRTVDAGSFTDAAKQLQVAKSAVSRRLQDLESRLGARLLIRTTRKLSLTPDGEAFYKRAKALLADWKDAEDVVSNSSATLSGMIRLAAPLSFGVAHLGPALLQFKASHPDIEYDIDFSDRQIDMIAEGVDLTIRIGQLQDSSLVARKLATVRMLAAASPDYLKRHGVPNAPSDLKTLSELRYAYRSEIGWTFSSRDGVEETVTMAASIRATNGDFLTAAAIAGQGVVIQPSFLMYRELAAGTLVPLLDAYTLPELGLYAVYPPTRHLSKKVRNLVDFLKDYCGETPYWENW